MGNTESMDSLLQLAVQSAAAGARCLQEKFAIDAGVLSEVGKDLKTEADLAAQASILTILHQSGIPVLAEEGAKESSIATGRIWLVDPLDGTFNFARGFPIAAVSVALWEDGKPLIGVIHDVFSDDVYSGSVAYGARLGDRVIHVSDVADIRSAALATGLPVGRDYSSDALKGFIESLQQFKKVRMLGSAAMMLAQVAAGRFDVYEEEDINLWDVAAGLALVQAAGGTFSMQPGSGAFEFRVRASNGHL